MFGGRWTNHAHVRWRCARRVQLPSGVRLRFLLATAVEKVDDEPATPSTCRFDLRVAGAHHRRHRRRRRRVCLHGGMVFARAPHAGQAGGCVHAARRAPPLGHRRNHAKGICFTGIFEANGAGSACRRAQVFAHGQYPVLGRFNLGTPNPNAPDATVRVRGMGLRISTPDGAGMAQRDDRSPVLSGVDAARLLRAAGRLGQQGAGRDEDFRRGASRIRGVRRLGQERALDRQLCGGALQQPQQLHLHRRFRHGSCGAVVAAAGGAAGPDLARRSCQARPRLPRAGDHRARRAAARCAGRWW